MTAPPGTIFRSRCSSIEGRPRRDRLSTGKERFMAAFLIVHRRNITDSETLKEYARGVESTIKAFGGEVVVRSDNFDVLEGHWTPGKKHVDSRPERITVVKFPDMPALKSWYDSDQYAEFKVIRQSSSDSDIVAVQGDDIA
jgi:uncharacterized protein (DUF1330 family)